MSGERSNDSNTESPSLPEVVNGWGKAIENGGNSSFKRLDTLLAKIDIVLQGGEPPEEQTEVEEAT